MKPMFSLLHVSARPDKWIEAYAEWLQKADHPESLEYILCVDAGTEQDFAAKVARVRLVLNHGRECTVDAWNAAAMASTGAVLVLVADDTFPCEHWDTLLLQAIGDTSREAAVHVDYQDPWPWIMTHPILTRAYYERPGRGGCRPGDVLYHEYISVGSDDDFTEYAHRDGVVIECRTWIHFEHRHPLNASKGLAVIDATYRHSNRQEAWDVKERVIGKRRRNGFTDKPDPLKSLTIITPGNNFSGEWRAAWDQFFYYVSGRFAFRMVYGESNNIYQVRQETARKALAQGVPDYVLWIDSDNPPTIGAFQALLADLQASERNTDPKLRPIDICGAWYRYIGPDKKQSYIAAGRDFGLNDRQLTEAEVLDALKRKTLIDDLAFIGFGLLLMRGSVLAELGPQAFVPVIVDDARGFLTDDVSWCLRAKQRGHLIYLNPAAHVEHLKLSPVEPPRFDLTPISEFRSNAAKQLEEVAL